MVQRCRGGAEVQDAAGAEAQMQRSHAGVVVVVQRCRCRGGAEEYRGGVEVVRCAEVLAQWCRGAGAEVPYRCRCICAGAGAEVVQRCRCRKDG